MPPPHYFQGAPFRPSAHAFNAMSRAAAAHQQQQFGGGSPPIRLPQASPTEILVRNDTAGTVPALGVLALDVPLILPSASLNQFAMRVAFSGIAPVAGHVGTGRFCVLPGPLAAGKIGRGFVSGAAPAQIDVVNANDEWADVVAGTTASLRSGGTGTARILWKAAGTGLQWGVVLLGVGSATALVYVNSNATGGGKYYGYVVEKNLAAVPATGNLSASEIGTNGTESVLILNAAEIGQSTHDLTAGTPVVKHFPAIRLPCVSSETPAKPVYLINGFDWANCT